MVEARLARPLRFFGAMEVCTPRVPERDPEACAVTLTGHGREHFFQKQLSTEARSPPHVKPCAARASTTVGRILTGSSPRQAAHQRPQRAPQGAARVVRVQVHSPRGDEAARKASRAGADRPPSLQPLLEHETQQALSLRSPSRGSPALQGYRAKKSEWPREAPPRSHAPSSRPRNPGWVIPLLGIGDPTPLFEAEGARLTAAAGPGAAPLTRPPRADSPPQRRSTARRAASSARPAPGTSPPGDRSRGRACQ